MDRPERAGFKLSSVTSTFNFRPAEGATHPSRSFFISSNSAFDISPFASPFDASRKAISALQFALLAPVSEVIFLKQHEPDDRNDRDADDEWVRQGFHNQEGR